MNQNTKEEKIIRFRVAPFWVHPQQVQQRETFIAGQHA